ncbi:unnamed protein product, partial [Leptidea sinapis]
MLTMQLTHSRDQGFFVVAVVTELECWILFCESLHKNMAVLGLNSNVNMNGHSNIHSQLTKSLERILEDAFLSGELKLSGRKLREFPKPVKFDLSDTVIADLSKNRFSDLPEEVATYVYLEKLLLSQNVIRNIPDAVGSLQSLTYLDLR